jgi:hypothetical protein
MGETGMSARALLMVLAALAACAAPAQTNRDLDRIARDYQRRQAEEQAANPASVRPAEDTCRMAENRHLIGVAESDLQAPPHARVICFGCMATMDFNATRLTIQIGADHKVASMQCG